MEDAEEQTLAASVSTTEHDVHADRSRNIDIDLYIIGRAFFLQFVEDLNKLFVGLTPSTTFGRGGQESMPCGCTPLVGHTLPSTRHEFGICHIELKVHATTSETFWHQTSHLAPLLFAQYFAPSQKAFVRILFGEIIEAGGQCKHIARIIQNTAVA
jgi:hypothetical protein